jgi:hypothetical protein
LIFFENNCSRIHIPNPYLIVLSLRKRELPNLGLKPHTNNNRIFQFFRFYNIRNLLKFSWKFIKISQQILNTKKKIHPEISQNFPKIKKEISLKNNNPPCDGY